MSANEEKELADISSMDNHPPNIPEAVETVKRKLSDGQDANANTSAINKRRRSEDDQDAVSGDKATIKMEAPDEIESASSSIPVTIKEEPVEENDDSSAANVSKVSTISTNSNTATIPIKKELTKEDPSADSDEHHDDSPAVDVSSIATANTSPSSSTVPIKKESSNDDTFVKTDAVSSSAVIVKTEPNTSLQVAIADSSVSSSTLRPSCRFGIKCYR